MHPYIRRKNGAGAGHLPAPDAWRTALERTLGIPLFQEQLMQLAVDVADFTPAEADQLRRAMGSKRSEEQDRARCAIRLYDGMAANGITGAVADEIYEKIKAFAAFGFAESHSISFALLVYASSWLKRHYPAAFCAALLNAQPMGFYSPQSLVHDAKRHGVEVRGPVRSTLSLRRRVAGTGRRRGRSARASTPPQPAVRLGLSSVRTIGTELAERDRRRTRARRHVHLDGRPARRVGLSADQVEALATAGAFDCFGPTAATRCGPPARPPPPVPASSTSPPFDEHAAPPLPAMTEPEQLIADMWATGITPRRTTRPR